MKRNSVFGSPKLVIDKLNRNEESSVYEFIYYASMGLEHTQQIRLVERFCEEMLPEFT
ncbi:MAG: hypothetical protein OXE41_01570 [Gammaproteobacteria bacterium]|nr:hypothetical protein [Gammaproteobacteria bacterium]MCY4218266.1 hypothetical protein [Gammaproteobacteria bacterium]MCY4274079.1 hypothetical protein [Gammaproteobacteria bacterium]